MKNKYVWDLEDILDGKTFEDLHQQWKKRQAEILKLFPSFYTSLQNFKKWTKLENEYEIIANRLFNYVQNNHQENQIDPKWISITQKLSHEGNEFNIKIANINNIIIKNKKKIKSYLKDKSLQEYARSYDLVFRNEPHILPGDQQKILTKVGRINSGFDNIFSTLTDCDIKFADAETKDGTKKPITTFADVSINLKSKDRKLRETTWKSFNRAFASFENTLTQTLYYNYMMLNCNAQVHKFKDYIEATAHYDEISPDFIPHIYSSIATYKNIYVEYRKTAKKLLMKQLKLKKLEPWDKSVDLIKKKVEYTIEDAQKIALEALSPLGEEYVNNIKNAFENNWISWLPKKNKQTGAYSIGGSKGMRKYYISMNFDKTIGSVGTLVHELGHSMHSLYFNKEQKVYTDCSIFYAEIASIVNEVLLSNYWINKYKNDKEMKIMVLDELINGFFSTTIRQIVFSNFEYEANKFINENKPFTKEELKKTYLNMMVKYQGVKQSSIAKYEKEPYSLALSIIFRIGHFYVGNFYVYKYAIGQVAAIIIAKKIINGDRQAVERYFKFLKSGSSKPPLETIKILGIDLTKDEPFKEAKTIVAEWIKEFKK